MDDKFRRLDSVLSASGNGPRIAVVGDMMLDEHVTCEVVRLSPEDDLAPILRVVSTTFSAGGAANVAVNLSTLGAAVSMYGCIGLDAAGLCLTDIVLKHKIKDCCFRCGNERPTTTKTRYITPHGRHAMRIDREETDRVSSVVVEDILRRMEIQTDRDGFYDVIIVSDYAKGVVRFDLMEGLRKFNRPILVDPKADSFLVYGKVTAIKANEKEARLVATRNGESCIEDVIKSISHEADKLIITLSEQGCVLCDPKIKHFKASVRELGDPTGCGDSFMAGLAFGIACGREWEDAVRIAVAAGSVAFDHNGVHSVTREEIRRELLGAEA